ncbi:MAG: pyridoxine 5'-phosphate synthase [Pirellulales bacterium]|nr:pyridoxine 5'-phosphate synthase [Pirellulales bacterium]
MPELGINIDHVATVREARKTNEPDPVLAAALADLGGADGITFHLREDRRHIQDRDVQLLRETVTLPLNFELACEKNVVDIACQIRPYQATLVPERRAEVTTEGGLDVFGNRARIIEVIQQLHDAGIVVSLFLDPDEAQIEAGQEVGANAVELHTGAYAHAAARFDFQRELDILRTAAACVVDLGMVLHAGHGLTYHNVKPVAAIQHMGELNIGHSIIARSITTGLVQAVRDMKRLIERGAGLS